MHIKQWDEAYKNVCAQITKLDHPKHTAVEEQITVTQKQAAILQFETAIKSNAEHIAYMLGRQLPLNPVSHSIIHCSKAVAESLLRLYEKKVKLLSGGLWLSLIRSRLGLPSSSLVPFAENLELTELGNRHKDLKKEEKRLERELARLNTEKTKLKAVYDEQTLAKPVAGSSNLAFQSLNTFINSLSTGANQGNLIDETDEVVKSCRTVLSRPDLKQEPNPEKLSTAMPFLMQASPKSVKKISKSRYPATDI